MHSCPNLEPVCCFMSGSNCSFLTCIQISQEAGKVVWYSILLKNFPQFVMIYTVKGIGVINKAKIDVFLIFSCFFPVYILSLYVCVCGSYCSSPPCSVSNVGCFNLVVRPLWARVLCVYTIGQQRAQALCAVCESSLSHFYLHPISRI